MTALLGRRRRRRHEPARRAKPGSPPGQLVADPDALPPLIHVIAYSPEGVVELDAARPEDLRPLLSQCAVTWVDVSGLGDAEVIRQLGELFGLHALALEDVVNVHQRPKLEPYSTHQYLVLRMVELAETVATEQVSIFLGRNFVVTFQEAPGDCFGPVRARIRAGSGRIRKVGPDYLVYCLIDAIVDAQFPVLERLGERLQQLEDEIIEHPEARHAGQVQGIKRDLLVMRRVAWPARDAISAFHRDPSPLVCDETRVFLRDSYDHAVQVMDLVETYREIGSSLTELHLSSISNRLNEVMRLLTMIATIFIPLSFVASLYGMNFDTHASPWNMPELRWRYGYPMALGLMAAIAGGLVWFFRRRGWLRDMLAAAPSRPRRRRDDAHEWEARATGHERDRAPPPTPGGAA